MRTQQQRVHGRPVGRASTAAATSWVVDLDSPAARDPELVGGKAASLAVARAQRIATLPGVVLTTAFCDAVDAGVTITGNAVVRAAFDTAGGSHQRLVARSSSPFEDQAAQSMAGQFESVIGINGLEEFERAVAAVLASRVRAGAGRAPIAVLVQPYLDASLGGVAFGLDPVVGRGDHRVVTAVAGQPGALVGGDTRGSHYLLNARGKVLAYENVEGVALGRVTLRRLLALADRAAATFGGPQDIEWAIDRANRLWLLQSRPITSENRGVPTGPVYGPGPVAETFPEPLAELEEDLWVPPLREALRQAALLTGAATEAQLARTGVVVSVQGRVAIDLRVVGEDRPERHAIATFNPLPALRRLRAAWRVGRLRAALPRLAERVLDGVDADLQSVPPLENLTSRQLLALLHRGQSALQSLHAHEILMGMLVATDCVRLTGASVALRVLSEARGDGLDDDTIVRRSPVVLALTPPAIQPETPLPRTVVAPDLGQSCGSTEDAAVIREALRIRVRWVHELMGRAAWLVGERLERGGSLHDPAAVRHLTLSDVEAITTGRAVAVHRHGNERERRPGPPLPSRFQFSDTGSVIEIRRHQRIGAGTAAGGGVGTGRVTFDAVDPPQGAVLVTRTLSPSLGPVLPRLAGLVAETGSVLSHLAILAREFGVPVVVGYAGATTAFAERTLVTVDGGTGEVTAGGEAA